MGREIRAKFSCSSVVKEGNTEKVQLHTVYGNDDKDNQENNQFSEATPCGTHEMHIDNPDAQGFFEQGKNYYLDFSEAAD